MTKNKKLIIALDYSCLKYLIYYRGVKTWDENIHGFRPEVVQHWAMALRDLINQIATKAKTTVEEPCSVVIVGLVDQPFKEPNHGYWRSRVYEAQQQKLRLAGKPALSFKIAKQEVPDEKYKGNRLAKSSYSPFMKLCTQLMYDLPFKVFKAEGAEADDMAGLLAQGVPSDAHLYLVTLDQDWALLTALSPRVVWMNLHRANFLKVYDSEQALELFQKTYKKALTLSEVPEAKSFKGERGDNLAKGFDPRLADLINFSCPAPSAFPEEVELGAWDFTAIKDDITNWLGQDPKD